MHDDDLYFIRWIYKQDGTVWKQLYGEEPVLTSETWTEKPLPPPLQCPKCHAPYWNRERKK